VLEEIMMCRNRYYVPGISEFRQEGNTIRLSTSFLVTKATLLLVACCVFCVVPVLASGITQPNSVLVAVETSQLLNVQDWQEYKTSSYVFSIRYPKNLTLSTRGDFSDAMSGQVVAFVPVTIDSYSSTNLVNYSVLIGVTKSLSPSAAATEMKRNPLYAAEIQTRQGDEINGLYFSRYYSSEGAAGHWYEKISCRVVVNGIRYEIAMLIHSINLGAIPAGIVPFDVIRVKKLFETMLHTFRVME